jgi:hypothetical protein
MATKKVIYRKSTNGQITTKRYAEAHKATTERQHVPTGRKKK